MFYDDNNNNNLPFMPAVGFIGRNTKQLLVSTVKIYATMWVNLLLTQVERRHLALSLARRTTTFFV